MIALSLLIVGAAYIIGTIRVWAAAGMGRGVRAHEAIAFAAGWIALVVALESPLHEWSESLFAAHMVQHELIMVVAAPLIAIGAPLLAMLWALPHSWRRRSLDGFRVGRLVPGLSALQTPGVAFCVHAAALWIWHIPPLYEAALHNGSVHATQHLSFFFTAVMFWWSVAQGRYRSGGYGASVLYVFGTATQSGVLGALLVFSTSLWYAANGAGAAAWNLTSLEDQQLAGLVMWVPASIVFTAAGLAFLALWLRESERRAPRPLERQTREFP